MTGSSASGSTVSDRPGPLPAGAVHVWLCRSSAVIDEAVIAGCASVLAPAERERCARGPLHLQPEAILSRWLVRDVLSRYAQVEPAQWVFSRSVNGKPAANCGDELAPQFNLSHSHGWIACAVTRDAAIGVDIEGSQAKRDHMRLARRYFTAGEVVDLELLTGSGQRQRFYELWTLKEAWSKAQGTNIGSALGAVSFALGAPGVIVATAASNHFAADFWLAAPVPQLRLALCRHQQPQVTPSIKLFEAFPKGGWQPLAMPPLAVSANFGTALNAGESIGNIP